MRNRLQGLCLIASILIVGCGGGGGRHDDAEPYPAVGKVDGSDDEVVFKPGQVLTYKVTMSTEDEAWMEDHGVDEAWQATTSLDVTGDGNVVQLSDASIRHKGGYGTLETCWGESTPPAGTSTPADDKSTKNRDESATYRQRLWTNDWCQKISYKLKFKTAFHGLKKLNLHAESRDPTALHDMLAYSTFFEAGVDAPRTAPARLYINGVLKGLFIAVEDVDEVFAANRFEESRDPTLNGNLFKEIWPDPERLARQGADSFLKDATTILDDKTRNASDFLTLTQTMTTATSEGRITALEDLLDFDGLARYMAVDRAIKNWDGVTAMYTSQTAGGGRWPHNYYWYHDTTGRWHLVPWDMDNTFPANDPYMAPYIAPIDPWQGPDTVPDWNVRPLDCTTPLGVWNGNSWVLPPGCDPFLNLLAHDQWSTYETTGTKLLAGPLSAERLRWKAQRWASLIEPLVKEDPILGPKYAVQDWTGWKYATNELIDTILVNLPSEFEGKLKEGYRDETAQQ